MARKEGRLTLSEAFVISSFRAIPIVSSANVHVMEDFKCNKSIFSDLMPGNECTMIESDNRRKPNLKSISKDFRNHFIKDVAEANG